MRQGRKRKQSITLVPDIIDVRDIERRLMRAFKTLRALPDPERRFFNQKSAWPEVLQSFEEAYGYTEAKMPKFRPTPFDCGDYLTALDWVRGLDAPAVRLIVARSFDYSFQQMGDRIGKSADTAARYYKDAVRYAWAVANNNQHENKTRKSIDIPMTYKKPQYLVFGG
jgi:hypothetical protein